MADFGQFKVSIFQAKNFDGFTWGAQGPKLLTSVMQERCHIFKNESETSLEFNDKWCDTVNILHSSTTYPIYYRRHRQFYYPSYLDEVRAKVNSSRGVHYWAHMDQGVVMRPNQPLYQIMAKNCPLIENHLLRKYIGSTW